MQFKRDFWRRVTWSRADSPSPAICSMCAGALPEVPLRMWRDDGAAVTVCDRCVEQWMEGKR